MAIKSAKLDKKVILVTGLAGAGRTTTLRALEDIGFDAVDNLPISFVESVLKSPHAKLALGIDSRTHGFNVEFLKDLLTRHHSETEIVPIELLFITCDDDALERRFTETRRRHPLAEDRPVRDGITLERRLLEPLRTVADHVLDTTMLAPNALRNYIMRIYPAKQGSRLTLGVQSFSFALGLPRESDIVFDVRFLTNPYYDMGLRPFPGTDEKVKAFIAADPAFKPLLHALEQLTLSLLPRYEAEGRCYLTISIGCTGGRHRSVAVVESLADIFLQHQYDVHIHHRDLEIPR